VGASLPFFCQATRSKFESYLLVTRAPALAPATLAALPPTRVAACSLKLDAMIVLKAVHTMLFGAEEAGSKN